MLVLCDTYTPEDLPHPTNTRHGAAQVFDNPAVKAAKPWFGLEQEYTLFQGDGRSPLGWPKSGYPGPQGPYYCGVGTDHIFGRPVVEVAPRPAPSMRWPGSCFPPLFLTAQPHFRTGVVLLKCSFGHPLRAA